MICELSIPPKFPTWQQHLVETSRRVPDSQSTLVIVWQLMSHLETLGRLFLIEKTRDGFGVYLSFLGSETETVFKHLHVFATFGSIPEQEYNIIYST